MRRKWVSVVAGAALVAASSSALAAGVQQGVLAPGHAASVHKAQLYLLGGEYLWVVGGVVVLSAATAAAISASGHNPNSAISTTTCPASQCPTTGTTTSTSTSATSTTGT
jgi:hypothetical protein